MCLTSLPKRETFLERSIDRPFGNDDELAVSIGLLHDTQNAFCREEFVLARRCVWTRGGMAG